MIRLVRYGSRFIPATQRDRERLADCAGYVEAEIFRIVPGSSVRKQFILNRSQLEYKARILSAAIQAMQMGDDVDTVVRRHGREYGPNLRRAVMCRLGYAAGPVGVGSFNNQTQDGADGATFGGGDQAEYGSPRNRREKSPLFTDVPDAGYGHGDEPAAHDPDHTPGKSTGRPREPRIKESAEFPGDTVVDNDQGYWEPFGDEQGVKSPPRIVCDRGPVLGVPIDPTKPTEQQYGGERTSKDNPKDKAPDGKIGGEQEGEFDTKEPPSIGVIDHGTYRG